MYTYVQVVNHRDLRFASVLISALAADALVSLAFPGSPAIAQVPGAVNPGVQLQEQIRESAPPPRSYEAPIKIETKEDSLEGSDTSLEKTFFFKAVRFEGNKIIRTGILSQPFLPLIGQDITLSQLREAASQAELNYKNDGYLTSRVLIPSQNLNSGNVVVKVIEGFIEDIEVRGATTGLQAYIRKMLQPVVNDGPDKAFNFKTLERQLLLVRNFGGVTFNSSLARGSKLGGSLLIIDLNSKSFSGGVAANNNLPSQLGDYQFSGNLQYITPTSQPFKIYAAGSYAFPYTGGLATGTGLISSPIGNRGFKADGMWSSSYTSSKDLFDGPAKVQTRGSSNYWSFGISYPLLLKRNSQLSLALQGTGQNSTNDLYLDNSKGPDLSTDKIRAIRLLLDGYYASPRSTNTMSLKISQGIGGLNSDLEANEFLSNPYGDSNFTTARLNLSRTQKLFDFGTQLTVKGTGQLSSTAVPVPEAITYGGPLYGRAFRSVYILGDQGVAASIELSHQINLPLFNASTLLTPFAWYDYGDTQYKKGPLPNQTVSTYGIGLRYNAFNVDLELGWGIPATNSLDSNYVGTGNSSMYFNAGWRF